MGKYYFMSADDPYYSDYIRLDSDSVPEKLSFACCMSRFQHIEKSVGTLEVSEESGYELADFIYGQDNVPLISERLKRLFDSLDIRNLFYQRVRLIRKSDNLCESYWLAVPPRIDALDNAKSIKDDILNTAEYIAIDDSMVGNYDIFKLAGVVNNEIIVTEKLKNAVEKKNFMSGFGFLEVTDLV